MIIRHFDSQKTLKTISDDPHILGKIVSNFRYFPFFLMKFYGALSVIVLCEILQSRYVCHLIKMIHDRQF